MKPVIVDNSVFLAWCLGDEEEPAATSAMEQVAEYGGIVPRTWWYELRNALLMNERRSRITQQQVSDTLADSLEMEISIDEAHEESLLLDLARRVNLSVYDAACLETALRRGLPLGDTRPPSARCSGGARNCALAQSRLNAPEPDARGQWLAIPPGTSL